ncbi:MAG: IS21-like element helper ATPase IstB [Symbiobacteriaceae bacterium]|nr:IS21-like element helper ATPase IstB [Symbiobacteriaceae bacterium]
MLINETLSKLREMKLSSMAASLQHQLDSGDFAELPFEDRLSMVVDAEWASRKSNRIKRLIRRAAYAIPGASLEDIDYHADRKLDKPLIMRMGSGSYLQSNHNLIILGATGSGKTFLACAFGIAANRSGLPVRYIRLPELLHDLALARAEGYYQKALKAYRQVTLLIIDEWLLMPLREAEARDLLDIIDARHKRVSTIFCSQWDVPGWHEKIGEPTLADAICDRIAHDSRVITIQAKDSMRKLKGIQPET